MIAAVLMTECGGRGVPGIHGDVTYSEDFQAALIRAAWGAPGTAIRRSLTRDRRHKAALCALTEMYRGKLAEPVTGAGR